MGCTFAILASALHASASTQPTVFILDASASMATVLGEETRLSVAKSSLRDAIDEIHRSAPDHQVALVSFYDGCWVHRMENVAPISTNRGRLLNQIDAIATREYGHTPIAKSLEVAAEIVKGTGGSIILVSDGQESCDTETDLCELARHLLEHSIRFEVNLIGLALSKQQSDAIRCVPEITGGSFFAANDPASLTEALGIATEQSITPAITGCLDNRGGLLSRWCGQE